MGSKFFCFDEMLAFLQSLLAVTALLFIFSGCLAIGVDINSFVLIDVSIVYNSVVW